MKDALPITADGREVMGRVWAGAAVDPLAWETEPLGHTRYQLKHFVLKTDNPTADSQYRQGVRELWTRWQAFRQAKVTYETNAARSALLSAEAALLSRACSWRLLLIGGLWGDVRDYLSAHRALRTVQADNLKQNNVEIALDLEHRILREAKHLLSIMEEIPKPAVGVDRMEVERDNWATRGVMSVLGSEPRHGKGTA